MRNTEFIYKPEWENDGMLVWKNAKTIETYNKLRYNSNPDGDKLGFFFAFSDEQFKEGYSRLVKLGFIKDGDKIAKGYAGLFGTKKGLYDMSHYYENITKEIAEKCDPAEVYAVENNNHESCISPDGDATAWDIVCDIFGKERCENEITRYFNFC